MIRCPRELFADIIGNHDAAGQRLPARRLRALVDC